MPFYEYQCSQCGHLFEAMQKIAETPLRKCPACGKNTLKKLLSAPVFRLKGSGWYETDFKSDQEKKRNLAGAEVEPASSGSADKADKADKGDKGKESSDSGKADAKPAAAGSAESAAKPAATPAGNGAAGASSEGKRRAAVTVSPRPSPSRAAKPAKATKPVARAAPAKRARSASAGRRAGSSRGRR